MSQFNVSISDPATEHAFIDFAKNHNIDVSKIEIEVILNFVLEQMRDIKLEINYVIEQKNKNGQNHIHCFVKCNNKKKLIQCFRLGFSQVSYHQSPIFDLESWKGYVTKYNNEIKTLKNG